MEIDPMMNMAAENQVEENLEEVQLFDENEKAEENLAEENLVEENLEEVQLLDEEEARKVEDILGYKFFDRRLLAKAFIHPSSVPDVKHSYKRLEFLGDSIAETIVVEQLTEAYPKLDASDFNRLREINISNEKFARIIVAHKLESYLRHSKSKFKEFEEFKASVKNYAHHSYGMIKTPKVLADILESLIGAVFVDTKGSMKIARQIFMRLAKSLISWETIEKYPVEELDEFCKSNQMRLKYDKLNEGVGVGVTCEVFVDDKLVSSGSGIHKKSNIAKNIAAKVTLNNLKSMS